MQTDRELLEAAAKAAGVEIKTWGGDQPYIEVPSLMEEGAMRVVLWNPLTDDGDALRLAVNLGLAIRVLEKFVFVESEPETLLGQSLVSELEMYGRDDKFAATRRAIVRAAAALSAAQADSGEKP